MNIKTGVKIVIAASLCIVSISIGTSLLVGRHVREIAGEVRSFNTIIEDVNGLRGLTYDYLLYPTDRAGRQWLLIHDSISSTLSTFKMQTSKELGVFEDLIERHARTRDIFERLIRFHENGTIGPGKDIVRKEAENRLTGQLLIETQSMVSDVSQLSSSLSQRSRATLRLADSINLGAWIAVLLLIIINSLYIFSSVVRPLFRLHRGVGIAAAGDLDHRVGIDIQNEVGDLSRSFDQMTANLKEHTFQLERSNRELEDFAFITSHDLQEPLRKIQTFSDRLRAMMNDSAGDKARDFLDRIERSAGRMQGLIFALFRYSCIKSSIEPMRPIDLKGIVEQAAADLESLRGQIEGVVEVGELPCIEADQAQMRHLFQNLIDNSLRYQGEQKPFVQIYSNCTCSDGCFEIHVKDNGIGFDQSFLDKVFKPFQRLHGKDSPYQGTGIGLTICRRIVERHGGGITAQSEPDKGSVFTVRLPQSQRKRGSLV